MKKILVALVALLMTTGAFAQGFGGGDFNPEDMVKRQVDHIKELCGLNDEQTKKISDYMTESQKKMMEEFQKAQQDGGGMPDMSGFQKRREEQTKFIKSVLTEEQFKKYDEDQKKMMERFQNGGGF